jgi:hypothetical protein
METTRYSDISIEILDQFSDGYQSVIRELNKKIKSDDIESGSLLPKFLDENNFIIILKNKNSKEIYSFIWYGYYFNDNFGNFLHINFSFTFIKFRNNGYNKLLRLQLENICIRNKINYITSTPFEDSPSKTILVNLGYQNENKHFYKRIGLD